MRLVGVAPPLSRLMRSRSLVKTYHAISLSLSQPIYVSLYSSSSSARANGLSLSIPRAPLDMH